MIYGDPDKIAFQFDAVKCWNTYKGSWINGAFTVYIDGKVFFPCFSPIPNVTLNTAFGEYQIDIDSCFSRVVDTKKEVEVEIYLNREPGKICEEIYEKKYKNMDEKYFRIKNFLDLTSEPLMDEGYYIFCFLLDKNDIIFYGSLDKMNDSKKIILPKGTMRDLMADIAKYPFMPGYRISWGENYHYYP